MTTKPNSSTQHPTREPPDLRVGWGGVSIPHPLEGVKRVTFSKLVDFTWNTMTQGQQHYRAIVWCWWWWCRLGLSLEHATDITSLTAELDKVERQLRELTSSSRTRYAPKQRRDELRCELERSVAEKEEMESQVESLRRQEVLLRTGVDAAQTFVKMQSPHQTVADAVLLALHNNYALYGISHTLCWGM